jgi:membrane protease YdiL (CAAX protease family)
MEISRPLEAEFGGPGEIIENPIWTFGDIVLITLAGVAFFFLFLFPTSLVASSFAGLQGDKHKDLAETVIAVVTQAFTYAGILLLVRRIVQRRATSLHRYLTIWAALRWNPPRQKRAFLGVGAVLAVLFAIASQYLPVPHGLPIEQAFSSTSSAYITAVFGIAVAPLFEEIYFRGLLYPVFVRGFRRSGPTMAVALSVTTTAGLFALLHGSQLEFAWAPMLVVFSVGVVLTLVRSQTRSLAASWMVHLCYNTTLFALTFIETSGFRKLQ